MAGEKVSLNNNANVNNAWEQSGSKEYRTDAPDLGIFDQTGSRDLSKIDLIGITKEDHEKLVSKIAADKLIGLADDELAHDLPRASREEGARFSQDNFEESLAEHYVDRLYREQNDQLYPWEADESSEDWAKRMFNTLGAEDESWRDIFDANDPVQQYIDKLMGIKIGEVIPADDTDTAVDPNSSKPEEFPGVMTTCPPGNFMGTLAGIDAAIDVTKGTVGQIGDQVEVIGEDVKGLKDKIKEQAGEIADLSEENEEQRALISDLQEQIEAMKKALANTPPKKQSWIVTKWNNLRDYFNKHKKAKRVVLGIAAFALLAGTVAGVAQASNASQAKSNTSNSAPSTPSSNSGNKASNNQNVKDTDAWAKELGISKANLEQCMVHFGLDAQDIGTDAGFRKMQDGLSGPNKSNLNEAFDSTDPALIKDCLAFVAFNNPMVASANAASLNGHDITDVNFINQRIADYKNNPTLRQSDFDQLRDFFSNTQLKIVDATPRNGMTHYRDVDTGMVKAGEFREDSFGQNRYIYEFTGTNANGDQITLRIKGHCMQITQIIINKGGGTAIPHHNGGGSTTHHNGGGGNTTPHDNGKTDNTPKTKDTPKEKDKTPPKTKDTPKEKEQTPPPVTNQEKPPIVLEAKNPNASKITRQNVDEKYETNYRQGSVDNPGGVTEYRAIPSLANAEQTTTSDSTPSAETTASVEAQAEYAKAAAEAVQAEGVDANGNQVNASQQLNTGTVELP